MNIKTYPEGRQVAVFCYEASSPLDYPIAIEGDFLIKQEYEIYNGEYQIHDLFFPEDGFLVCRRLPEGFTGSYLILYGKYLHREDKKNNTVEEFAASCENITRGLKEIDQKNKETEFIATNNSASKNDICVDN